jgi:hypothetical protein
MENADPIRYNEADIRRYHEGRMLPTERHALEKAALEDPFLADALDGLAEAPGAGADIELLRETLSRRIRRPRRSLVVLYSQNKGAFRVAAAVLLLAGAGWVATTLSIGASDPVAIKAPAPIQTRASVPPSTTSTSLDSTGTFENDVAVTKSSPERRSPRIEPSRAPTAPASRQTSAWTNNAPDTVYTVSSMNAHASMNNGQVVANAAARSFTGRIVDSNGYAIPYAAVSLADKKLTTLSDSRGDFQLSIPDSSAEVTVSAAGYQSNRVALKDQAQNEVTLKPAGELKEVVVTAAPNPRRAKMPVNKVEEGQLEPEEGWVRFNDYLAQHLKGPDKMEMKPVSGEVTLSFDVSNEGEPVNIAVVKSLCAVCDELAIQLLKQGPKWKLTKSRKGTIVIKF